MGKRAVVLCTKPFTVTARNIVRMLGLPDYPFAILDHPIGSCTPEEIRTKAELAADQVEKILLGDSQEK